MRITAGKYRGKFIESRPDRALRPTTGRVREAMFNILKHGRFLKNEDLIRDDNPVESLRRIKDDVSEVRSGMECGIKLAGYDDVKTGDLLEAYELIEVSRTLESVE